MIATVNKSQPFYSMGTTVVPANASHLMVFTKNQQGEMATGISQQLDDLTKQNIEEGLAAYYPLDQNSDDERGHFRNGIVNGASPTTGRYGELNGAIKFDGNSNYAQLGDWFNYQEFSVSIWVNPGTANAALADILDNSHQSASWVIQQTSNTNYQYHFFLVNANNNAAIMVPFELKPNQWQHLVVSVGKKPDAPHIKRVRVFINGNLAVEQDHVLTIKYLGNESLFLGKWWRNDRYWRGEMDELRIYDREINKKEVTELFKLEHAKGTSAREVLVDSNTSKNVPLSYFNSNEQAPIYMIQKQPEHGSIALNGNKVVYTPQTGYVGQDSFTYSARDSLHPYRQATVMLNISEGFPIVFVHGYSVNLFVEATWKKMVEDLAKTTGYQNCGNVYAQDDIPNPAPTKKCMYLAHYYRNSSGHIPRDDGQHKLMAVINKFPNFPVKDYMRIPMYENIFYGYIGGVPADNIRGQYPGNNEITYSYSDRLAIIVDKVINATKSQKVNLVGHSAGGIVSRAYIKWKGGHNKVQKLLTVSTPNYPYPVEDLRFQSALNDIMKPETGMAWQYTELSELGDNKQFIASDAEIGKSLSYIPVGATTAKTDRIKVGTNLSFIDLLNVEWVEFLKKHNIEHATVSGVLDPWEVNVQVKFDLASIMSQGFPINTSFPLRDLFSPSENQNGIVSTMTNRIPKGIGLACSEDQIHGLIVKEPGSPDLKNLNFNIVGAWDGVIEARHSQIEGLSANWTIPASHGLISDPVLIRLKIQGKGPFQISPKMIVKCGNYSRGDFWKIDPATNSSVSIIAPNIKEEQTEPSHPALRTLIQSWLIKKEFQPESDRYTPSDQDAYVGEWLPMKTVGGGFFIDHDGHNDNITGADIAVGDVDGNGKLDMVLFHIDDINNDNNFGYYRIGWDMDKAGNPVRWTGSQEMGVTGLENTGAGIALGDINQNKKLDMIVAYVDATNDENQILYTRIAWDLDNKGVPTKWGEPTSLGQLGGHPQDIGIALGDIDKNGILDRVILSINDVCCKDRRNTTYYSIGWNMDTNGNPASVTPRPMQIGDPGSAWIGDTNAGAGVALADLDQNGKLELLHFFTDDPTGEPNPGFVRIVWNLESDGAPQTWTTMSIPQRLANDSRGGGIAVGKLNPKDMFPTLWVFHINETNDYNPGYYQVYHPFNAALDLEDLGSSTSGPTKKDPPPGMVAYFPFNGSANDESGKGNHAKVYDTTLTMDRFGNANKAYSFDGVRSYIRNNSFGDIQKENGQEITLAAWINPSKLGGSYQNLITNRSSDAAFNWILYLHVADGAVSFHGVHQYKSTYIPPLNKWTFIVVTVNSSRVSRIYANGSLVQETSNYQYNGRTPGVLSIGNFGTYQEMFQGKMDDIRIFNRALSESEIATLYQEK
ncbi:MAG: hypothetical protein HQM12_18585 [SAR324 cluster bacterium]|nr:hypothetical protein [SAR324 cluster bacterium]